MGWTTSLNWWTPDLSHQKHQHLQYTSTTKSTYFRTASSTPPLLNLPLEVELADPKFFEKAIPLRGGDAMVGELAAEVKKPGRWKRNPKVSYDLGFLKISRVFVFQKSFGCFMFSHSVLRSQPAKWNLQIFGSSIQASQCSCNVRWYRMIYHQRCAPIQMHLYRSVSYGMKSSSIWLCSIVVQSFASNGELYEASDI